MHVDHPEVRNGQDRFREDPAVRGDDADVRSRLRQRFQERSILENCWLEHRHCSRGRSNLDR
jgi:hypothetical protein